jgi:D-alanyl-lipoteichoic acid acyltransferase DltB (MBOAT superfamily)
VLFPTVTFAVFFTVVFAAVWASRSRPRLWRLVLLAAAGVFYAWWDVRFLALIAGSIVVNHLAVSSMSKHAGPARLAFGAGLTANLVLLGFFKYYGFFVDSLRDLLRPIGLEPPLPLLEIVLPVGISFFTFEAIAYLIEVRRGDVEPMPLLDFAVYLSFFPKLVSGPITRPSEFTGQLAEPIPADRIQAPEALWRIARGLFKKVVIAAYLGEAIVDGVFSTPGQFSGGEVLVGIYAYTAQIYIDFSAYTDMAIGLALLLGFRLPENFRAPYAATSVHEFWSRWHMTLTRWIRDFVFFPLAKRGSRSLPATARNLMLVMVLVGLWHGAGWTFVVWGGIHGVALVAERSYRTWRRRRRVARPQPAWWRSLLRTAATFHVVALAWVFFRADSIQGAVDVLARLGGVGAAPEVTLLLVAVLAAVMAAQFVPPDWSERAVAGFARAGPAFQAGVLAVVLLVADVFGPEGVPPFIYFRF